MHCRKLSSLGTCVTDRYQDVRDTKTPGPITVCETLGPDEARSAAVEDAARISAVLLLTLLQPEPGSLVGEW